MTDDRPDIDRIVREVLLRLRATVGVVADAPHDREKTNPAPVVSESVGASAKPVTIEERIVTVDAIRKRIQGATRLLMRSDAIVTPAARDLINEHGIQLVSASDPLQPHEQADAFPSVALGVAGCNFDTKQLTRSAPLRHLNLQQLARSGVTSVLDELGTLVARGGALGLFFTDQTAAAVCLANRRRGVRAVHARDEEEAGAAVAAVAANLLIVNPHRRSMWQLIRIVHAFAHAGTRMCREEFCSLLA